MTHLRRCILIDADDLLSYLEGEHEAAGVFLPIYACYNSLQHVHFTCDGQLLAMPLNQDNQISDDTQALPPVVQPEACLIVLLETLSVCAAHESVYRLCQLRYMRTLFQPP